MQKVIILGRVGKDPEVRSISTDKNVASFSVADSEKWKDSTGEIKQHTEWFNVVAFGNNANVAEKYVKKGDLIYVEGKQRTEEYEKDGVKKYAVKIIVDKIQLLGEKHSQDNQNDTRSTDSFGRPERKEEKPYDPNDPSSDLPFN